MPQIKEQSEEKLDISTSKVDDQPKIDSLGRSYATGKRKNAIHID